MTFGLFTRCLCNVNPVKEMKHWIFDLDNTLVDSFPSYTRVLIEVTERYGVMLSKEDQKQVRHLILPKFLEKFLSADNVEPAFREVIELNLARQNEIKPFEGIVELLSFLSLKGCRLSVFTARELITTKGILSESGLDIYFDQVISRECVLKSKPFPDGIYRILGESKSAYQGAVMVGDHKTDMEAAQAAGIKRISVCWDQHDSDIENFSDHHFVTVSELQTWAKKVLSF